MTRLAVILAFAALLALIVGGVIYVVYDIKKFMAEFELPAPGSTARDIALRGKVDW